MAPTLIPRNAGPQLTGDKAIFRELPAKVQRQVWEFDKNLLQQDALPPVGQYKYEVATIMRWDVGEVRSGRNASPGPFDFLI